MTPTTTADPMSEANAVDLDGAFGEGERDVGCLEQHPDPMEHRTPHIADPLGISAPTASDAMNALVAKGLVAKAPGPDRRSISLVLTSDGEAAADRSREWPEFLAEAVNTLPAAEQAMLLRALVKVIRSLQVKGDIPVQRMCVSCRFFRPQAHRDPVNPHHCAYVDAAFGDRHLRLNCAEHQPAALEEQDVNWARFTAAPAASAVDPAS